MKQKQQKKQELSSSPALIKCDWETLTDLEASLRKTFSKDATLSLNHEEIELMKNYCKQIGKAI